MDDARTRKEVVDAADRADPGDTGAWFFIRGSDALRVVRGFLRGTAIRDWIWLVLAGVALWRFWQVPALLVNIAIALKGKPL